MKILKQKVTFWNSVLDERRAELNFEGTRLFDLARTGKVERFGSGVQTDYANGEIDGTNGVVEQNPGYQQHDELQVATSEF